MGRFWMVSAVGCVLCCGYQTARCDDVDDVVKMLAGTAKGDLVLAGKFLSAASEATADARLRGRLYEEAYKAGLRCKDAKGPVLSIRSAQAMLKGKPDDRAAWQDRLAAAYVRHQQDAKGESVYQAGAELVDVLVDLADERLSAGRSKDALRFLRSASSASTAAKYRRDEVQARIEEAVVRRRHEVRAGELKEKLSQGDAQVRSDLIRLYVIELDRPGEAVKLLSADCGEVLRTYVPLAAKQSKDLPKQACAELGAWYSTLARGASPGGRLRCLLRAEACYRRSLSLHSGGDAASLKARAMLGKVRAELKDLRPAGGTGKYLGTYRDQKKSLWVLAKEDGVHRLLPPGHHSASTSCKVAGDRLRFEFAPYVKGPGFPQGATVEFRLADVGRYEATVDRGRNAAAPPAPRVGRRPVPVLETTYSLTRMAEEPIAVFVTRDSVGGVYIHRFYTNGHVVVPTSKCLWKLRRRRIALRFPAPRAPGGAWVDTGTVSANGRSYNAINQVGGRNKATAILGRLPVR